jgi:hypothetical protein
MRTDRYGEANRRIFTTFSFERTKREEKHFFVKNTMISVPRYKGQITEMVVFWVVAPCSLEEV